MRVLAALLAFFASAIPALASGSAAAAQTPPDFTSYPIAWGVLIVLVISYATVVWGEQHELKKSIPVLIGAGVIWGLVATTYMIHGDESMIALMDAGFDHSIVEIGELTFFLITAMTFVITLQERNVFELIRFRMLHAGLSQRAIFWATGAAAFMLSPVLDNLTTALALVSVVLAVGTATRDRNFVVLAAINLVVAANAGGAFSPFGDITTLMVWQAEKVEFLEFFSIFLPSLVNWLVPALIMSFAIKSSDAEVVNAPVQLKRGAGVMIGIFALTMFMAVSGHMFFQLPPVIGMTTGLGLLMLYGYFLSHHEHEMFEEAVLPADLHDSHMAYLEEHFKPRRKPFDPMVSIKNLEWDTLLFFYGILMAVAGLAQVGFLVEVSRTMYGEFGATVTNIAVGLLSALVDNIPVMSAVLKMDPRWCMANGCWSR